MELLLVAVLAVAGAVGLTMWRGLIHRRRVKPQRDGTPVDDARVVRDFNNVFFSRTQADRERIISFWMGRSSCSRTEAMRLAVEDWRKEQRTWR